MKIAVAKNKFSVGLPKEEHLDAYQIMDAAEALSIRWPDDAHLVTYVVPGRERQARVNKDGIEACVALYGAVPESSVMMADVDNPGHAAWTPETLATAIEKTRELTTAGVYFTARGYRIVQPITAPISVLKFEKYLRRWLHELMERGFMPDMTCRDWSRHYRLPHVLRDGRRYESPHVRLDWTAIDLEPIPDDPFFEARTQKRKPRKDVPKVFADNVPGVFSPIVDHIASVIRKTVTENWHAMYLALAGSLLQRATLPEYVPAMVRSIALAAGSVKPYAHEKSAVDTCARWGAGTYVAGQGALLATWPAVAHSLNWIAPTEHAPTETLAEISKRIEDAIANPADGLTLIGANCGLGKTQACIRAAERRIGNGRLNARTSISVPTNALAIQITETARARGLPVLRVFGPLSLLRADGTPECQHHAKGLRLVEGGQNMRWHLCLGKELAHCEYYDTCLAKDGMDGDPESPIVVGSHALMGALDNVAGSTGVLFIDEPPHLLRIESILMSDLQLARALLKSGFGTRFGHTLRPIMHATAQWFLANKHEEDGTEFCEALKAIAARDDNYDLDELVSESQNANGVVGMLECVHAFFNFRTERGGVPNYAPPIKDHLYAHMMADPEMGAKVARASHVMKTLFEAVIVGANAVSVRVNGKGIVLSWARPEMLSAIHRDGSCILADASIEVHEPIARIIVSYEPTVLKFTAKDGARIARTMITTTKAVRASWMLNGEIRTFEPVLIRQLKVLVDWACELLPFQVDCPVLGIISVKSVVGLLRSTVGEYVDNRCEPWGQLNGVKPDVLDAYVHAIRPILARWPGAILWGHYGALRGLDYMKAADAIATLGDPWSNLGQVQADVDFLGIPGSWQHRAEVLCVAELEQAHGRLRSIWRDRPGRALHIGRVKPGGSHWRGSDVEVREMEPVVEAPESTMTQGELRAAVQSATSFQEMADEIDVGKTTLYRYLNGNKAIPAPIVRAVRVWLVNGRCLRKT